MPTQSSDLKKKKKNKRFVLCRAKPVRYVRRSAELDSNGELEAGGRGGLALKPRVRA